MRQSRPRFAGAAVLDTQVETALRGWAESDDFTEQTQARAAETASRFVRRLHAQGVEDFTQVTRAHCEGFLQAPTVEGRSALLATQHSRRVALRMLFRTLRSNGVVTGDPTLDIPLPPRSSSASRPLTDDEIVMGRASSRLGMAGSGSLRPAVIWAFAEATAVTSEISAVRIQDIDHADDPHWVRLPGTKRAEPRLGELTDWGRIMLTRHLVTLSNDGALPDAPLTYTGAATPGQAAAQASVSNALANTLRVAGLRSEPDVRPGSVRAWAGRRLYDGGMPIEQVARRLGVRSLDAAAEEIGLDWRTPP